MSVNGYLTQLASNAIIRDREKQSIRNSISTLQVRLNTYFGRELDEHFIFGSYSRGTILPRTMDMNSDIDYMVVFDDNSYRPQTYLDKLRRFVGLYYSRSEISQSNPTIVLSLNHIRFELVPATHYMFFGLRIPAKVSDFGGWIDTDPNDFNDSLVRANQNNENLIKPLVRLVKYWNAKNGYVYESYELEQMVVARDYWLAGGFLSTGQLKDYFYDFMESLNFGWNEAQWRKDKVSRAQQVIQHARNDERLGYEESAEVYIRRLLPPVNALASA